MVYDENIIRTARELASKPRYPTNPEIALLAIKQALLQSMGYDPAKEGVDDFLLRQNGELEKKNIHLKSEVEFLRLKPRTPREIIEIIIRKERIKGKQAGFLRMLSSYHDVYELEFFRELYRGNGSSSKLISLKRSVMKHFVDYDRGFITVKPLHGKNGKKGYRLILNYPNLKLA